ncbi:MAG: FtsH protease activity modulator HflK [Thermoanaerobaculia bacterium]|nr:FtsH protease activity modulator HflK [Thermoanaerobaculia bacterium]
MAETEPAGRSNEIRRMAQPAVEVIGALIRNAHWPIALLFVAYLFSGVTAVKPDEVAIVLRFGRVLGDSPGERIHTAGLLWALPRPLDEVVRVPIGKVHEVEIADLWRSSEGIRWSPESVMAQTIDPEAEGYCLTGDRNIVQVYLLARYRVVDPVAYVLLQEDPHALLRNVVKAEVVRATGRESIDAVLSEGRKVLGNTVRTEAQGRLDAVAAGLELIAVEIADFAPPTAVIPAFIEVNTAYIEGYRTYVEAQRYRETELPKAESNRDQMLADARIYAANLLADARGDAQAFEALAAEYQKNPRVVVERLYIEGVENAFSKAGRRKFVQPPVGEQYEEFRITISGRQ